MPEGILYEPRSLWSIGYVTRSAGDPGAQIRLDRQHFYNGTNHPITLQRLTLAPINYAVRRMAQANQAPSPTLPFYGSSVINRIGVSISAPFRQHYSGSQEFTLATINPLPRNMPPVRSADGVEPQQSSMWGLTALEFDKPLMIPRDGTVLWDVSAMSVTGRGGAEGALADTPVLVYMLFQESGGIFAGNTRGAGWGFVARLADAAQPVGQPDARFPYPRDPISQLEGSPAQVNAHVKGTDITSNPWYVDAAAENLGLDNANINGRNFKAQAPNRSGSARLTGMRIMYDQRIFDGSMDNAALYPDDPVEPMANRIGARAKNVSGTGEWWWREGAPISLVMDTVTSAQVYRLPAPITLGPGDTLDVELSFPGINAGIQGATDVPYQVGVSLNGFAAIEG